MFPNVRTATLGGSKFEDDYSFEFNLDATNHYIQTSDTYESVFRGSWSVVAWIKPEDAQQNFTQVIFGGANTDNEDRFYVSLNEDDTGHSNKTRIYYRSNDTPDNSLSIDLSSTHLPDGQGKWIHCVWVLDLDDDKFKIFINGASVSPTDSSVNFSASVNPALYTTDINPNIGNNNSDGSVGNRFEGKISELALYDIALTSNDAMTLYNGREPFDQKGWSKAQNVALWFRMGDEGSAMGDDNPIKDLSGNGNNGTLQNLTDAEKTGDTP